MPCPEKFKETLEKYKVDENIIEEINNGYEGIVSRTAKPKKAAYFKRAIDILDSRIDFTTKRDILDYNACCKSGYRKKNSEKFALDNAGLSIDERLPKIKDVTYMGNPIKNEDGTITVHAVYYKEDYKFLCACSNFSKVKRDYAVSKTYCFCCAGHFRFHYEIMLGCKLEVLEIVSSPLDSNGVSPCVFKMMVVER